MNKRHKVTSNHQKPKNRKYALKRLWSYLYYYKKSLFICLFLTIIANGLSLLGPYLTGQTIAAMEGTVDFEKVFLFAGLMIIFYTVSAILNYYLSRAMVKISQKVTYKMRKDVFNKLTTVNIKYYDNNQIGDILSRMSYDIDTINTSLAADFMSVITSIITVIFSLVMMIIMSRLLVLVFILTLPLSILITRKLSKKVKSKYRIRNQSLGILNGFSEEMITGHKTIQSYVLETEISKRFNELNETTTKATYEAGYYGSSVGPSVNFVSNLSVVLVGVYGAILFFLNKVLFSTYSSFTLYARRFSGPINNMSTIAADIQSALAAAERVFLVLDQEDEVRDLANSVLLLQPKGDIEFQDVSFGYDENPVLKHITLSVKAGQRIAIVGPTGSGKTTFVNLLMRFYDPSAGKILFDGIPIHQIKRKSLRSAFSMVLQDTWIFHGSVKDNIRYGNDHITDDMIIDACKKARIHHFIERLPKGYDTILTDEGIDISKGQKQLLVIARALLSQSQILILDEATSNVDTHTEIEIQKAMMTLMEGKTSFIIAHRLSTIKNADVIMVIKDGQLIEMGSHNDLMKQNGFYQTLFLSQFS